MRLLAVLLSLAAGSMSACAQTAEVGSAPDVSASRPDSEMRALRKRVAKLGFTKSVLRAKLYAPEVTEGRYSQVDTLENWLVELLSKGRFQSVTRINASGYQGVGLKREGTPTYGFLFRLDGGELFVTHYVRGDEILKANELPVRLVMLQTMQRHFDNLR